MHPPRHSRLQYQFIYPSVGLAIIIAVTAAFERRTFTLFCCSLLFTIWCWVHRQRTLLQGRWALSTIPRGWNLTVLGILVCHQNDRHATPPLLSIRPLISSNPQPPLRSRKSLRAHQLSMPQSQSPLPPHRKRDHPSRHCSPTCLFVYRSFLLPWTLC